MKKIIFFLLILSIISCGDDEVYEPKVRKSKRVTQTSDSIITPKTKEYAIPTHVNNNIEIKAETLKIMSISLVNNDSCKYVCQKNDSTWVFFVDKKGKYNPGTKLTNPYVVLGSNPQPKSFTKK